MDHVLPFYPLNNLKNQNLEEMKKTPEDIIILHMCTKNDNHMMYSYWDIECDRQNFLSFKTIFCCFTPLTTWKIKILKQWRKKEKKAWRYYHFTQESHKWQSYDVWFLKFGAWQRESFDILNRFLPSPPPPLRTGKIKILKNWKISWRYHHFSQV